MSSCLYKPTMGFPNLKKVWVGSISVARTRSKYDFGACGRRAWRRGARDTATETGKSGSIRHSGTSRGFGNRSCLHPDSQLRPRKVVQTAFCALAPLNLPRLPCTQQCELFDAACTARLASIGLPRAQPGNAARLCRSRADHAG